jgi:thiol-disulfide isomerase/thioredoxin
MIAGCESGPDKPPPPPPERRSESVLQTGPAPAATTAKVKASSAPRAPRKLCERPPAADGKQLADVAVGTIAADGESSLPDRIETGGRWTWVNLWAGWCGPCKEEMPVLRAWEERLGGLLRVAFVSIDDDERLSKRFLDGQPKGGVRRSYHLGELETRKKWLSAIGLEEVSTLPVHVLVDPEGAVRCVIKGAIEPQDLPGVEAFLHRKK